MYYATHQTIGMKLSRRHAIVGATAALASCSALETKVEERAERVRSLREHLLSGKTRVSLVNRSTGERDLKQLTIEALAYWTANAAEHADFEVTSRSPCHLRASNSSSWNLEANSGVVENAPKETCSGVRRSCRTNPGQSGQSLSKSSPVAGPQTPSEPSQNTNSAMRSAWITTTNR